ncbi:MAG: helix-turn-helix domain-containing protein [Coriobacteriaceae bacterium]|nr:helix-turn-helix domain-containing protein [Coriobacteriaceae bacterium]
MDNTKTGKLIRTLRKNSGLTQSTLASQLGVSDKAVSKWERGSGCPDVSLLPELAQVLGASIDALLSGELSSNDVQGGSMRQTRFYVCSECGNIVTSTAEAIVSCCGMTLQALEAQKADGYDLLDVEQIETEFFITSDHEMSKEHHVTFVAFLNGDTLIIRRLYPEWDLQVRLPRIGHGKLFHYCKEHGLFYQIV